MEKVFMIRTYKEEGSNICAPVYMSKGLAEIDAADLRSSNFYTKVEIEEIPVYTQTLSNFRRFY